MTTNPQVPMSREDEVKLLEVRVIPAHMVKESYGCPYCKKTSVRRSVMNRHVRICYANPDRDCETCSNEGVEFIHTLGANLGVTFDADERDCRSYIAQKEGLQQ